MSHDITIYTDGAARGNPGRGGYGVILMSGKHRKEISQGYLMTTNNRMELMAVIEGLKAVKKPNCKISIYSDSQYIVKAVKEKWLDKWVRTEFKGGKKNKDLWMQYYKLAKDQHITFHWVRGHADNPFNNRCDELATQAADGDHLLVDEGYIKEEKLL